MELQKSVRLEVRHQLGDRQKMAAARRRGRRLMGRRSNASLGDCLAAKLIYVKSRGRLAVKRMS